MKFIECIASLKALKLQFWVWLLQLPPFVAAYLYLDTPTFTSFSLLYLGVVTILTAAIGALSSLVAEKVRLKQEKDADVQDVMDRLDELAAKK